MLFWPPKDPSEVLDYDINWAPRLGTDTITTSAWIIPAGISLITSNPSFIAQRTKIWLAGGIAGQTYVLRNDIVSAAGITAYESVSILCKVK
jgi:hypothetical protein